uniref:Uncharacterized protein n=1 Tax=Heterorhabditis bacteriophora TaxID=37862 RepID=A0A1I7W875_HETBA
MGSGEEKRRIGSVYASRGVVEFCVFVIAELVRWKTAQQLSTEINICHPESKFPCTWTVSLEDSEECKFA